MSGPWAETVVRLRPTTRVDRYGDEIADWDQPPAKTPIEGVHLEPSPSSTDLEAGREADLSGLRLVAQRHLDITTADRVTARGHDWIVDGEPRFLRNQFTGRRTTELLLARLEG